MHGEEKVDLIDGSSSLDNAYISFRLLQLQRLGGALGGLDRELSSDQFENEGSRFSYGTSESATVNQSKKERFQGFDCFLASVESKLDKDAEMIVACSAGEH
ncbi:kelch repeat-containing serine/threonine phosphoesterase family protein [Corchorus capsularis]|uniref:Kelch repeat-containing serine/threonine phosphoesterase family protein n=1 Tax=Corchorus capsularis TaxID=210143 RepID=A0A1R3J0Y2_COCAP|nr:kelch repeat-containing serine/threonine phosphoesterase family protein [Corchorus capsularis]